MIDNIVMNLSNRILTPTQTEVLNKGLGFVPNFDNVKINIINNDIKKFERKLQLHFHFKSKDLANNSGPTDYIKPSPLTANTEWWPKRLNPHITDFCHNIKFLINKTLHGKRNFNLTKLQISALKELKQNKDIIIKRSDKGGAIAIMNIEDYESKIMTMLNDPIVYTRIYEDDTETIKTNTDKLINDLFLQNKIIQKQFKYLTNFTPSCPIFYGLPKVHKDNWPLRPIVSQINGPTCRLSEYLDKLLTIAESKIPYLLKDTTAFLNLIELNNKCPNNTFLVTMDVTSLYTNIPHLQGAEFVSEFYEETLEAWPTNYPLTPISKQELHTLILFLLQNCTFSFNNLLYKQNYGTTMGSKFSVKFANIYMYKWFQKYLNSYTLLQPNFLARLIDDCFFLWNNTEEELKNFFDYLNNCHPTIKFETVYSNTSVNFLDTTTYIENNIIKTKLYKKPTDKKKFLHFSSAHPLHIKKSIPFSQALRYKRIITDNSILTTELTNLNNAFIRRHYPKALLNIQINKINNIERSSLLCYQSEESKHDKFLNYLKDRSFLPLVIHFNFNMEKSEFINNFKSLWNNFLQSSTTITTIFNNELPQIVFKRGKTIGNYLITSNFYSNTNMDQDNINILASLLASNLNNPTNSGSFRCNSPLCKCCNSICISNYYNNKQNNNKYYLYDFFNCNSKDVIYYITCRKCNASYIGQTARMLKERLNNHRSDIKLKRHTTIAIHFNEPRHSFKDLVILAISDLSAYNQLERNKIELAYMKKLDTIYPKGLNFYPILE